MVGIVRQGAHVLGANVQHMVEQGRGVGETTGDALALLDEHDAAVARYLQQVCGQNDARRSSADDRNHAGRPLLPRETEGWSRGRARMKNSSLSMATNGI